MKSAIFVLMMMMLAGTALPRIAGAASPIGVQPDFPIPMCALPNGTLILCAWYNKLAYGGEQVPSGAATTFAPLTTSKVGTTEATITANFASTLTWAFENNPYINIQVANMAPSVLAVLSHNYYVHTKGSMAPLLTAAAEKLSAINLYSFAQAFGPNVVTPYVNSYSPATTKSQYLAYLAKTPPKAIPLSQFAYNNAGLTAPTGNGLSTGAGPTGLTQHSPRAQAWYAAQAERAAAAGVSPDAGYIPQPLPTMSLSDIWLEFYCAGEGTTAVEATVMWGQYVDGPLAWAAGIGYGAGTLIYNWTESVSPGYFEDMIEYMGTLWQSALAPTGTITVGEPISTTFPDGGTITYDDFDACSGDDIC